MSTAAKCAVFTAARRLERDATFGIAHGWQNAWAGLCAWLVDPSDREQAAILTRLMKSWPEYTGNQWYPVPHPYLSPQDAYRTQPKWQGEYGEARLRLLRHIITELDKELGE